ncbi:MULTISPECIES: metallophosphoesterase [Marichromatium]|uniref:Icc protein n=1 Tax=Marichromatium gracile TaxID=1048 RepID=A0A4V2W9M2_MARGR|nr:MULTISPECIES: metallophosphoesterase [Marichromatium]MBK1708868.1 phosphoesterase [Marichromatium gracile]RNE90378.1 phosphoesterase [Marichromatium sp. AB31]TCW35930.1 Icc protein [Marichromatium gracile]
MQPSPQVPAQPLRLLHLSDPHLYDQAEGRLLGMRTRHSFEAVLERALASAPADALLITGDLAHDEAAGGYRLLRDRLEQTRLPCYCVAGNHDHWPLAHEILGHFAPPSGSIVALGNWRLALLDSSLPGEVRGHVEPAQLSALGAWLETNQAPTLVCLHHHPVAVGSAWIDSLGVDNGEALVTLCADHPQVRAILFGHVHQAFAQHIGRLELLAAPATSVQFLKQSRGFALDTRPPGYRELLLHGNGHIETRVIRLNDYPEHPDLEASGY